MRSFKLISRHLFVHSALAILALSIVAVSFIYVLEDFQYRTSMQKVASKMAARAEITAHSLIGPMLVDNENEAIEQIITMITKEENLTFARVISGVEAFGEIDSHCDSENSKVIQCIDYWSGKIRVYVKVKAGDDTIGVLEKIRLLSKSQLDPINRQPYYILFALILMIFVIWTVINYQFVLRDVHDPLLDLYQQKSAELLLALESQSDDINKDLEAPVALLKTLTENRDHDYSVEEIRLLNITVKNIEQALGKMQNKYTKSRDIKVFTSWREMLMEFLDTQSLKGQQQGYRFKLRFNDSAKSLRPIGRVEEWKSHLMELIQASSESGATEISLSIARTSENRLQLQLRNNGKLIRNQAAFENTKNYIRALGGQFTIESNRSTDNTIFIEVMLTSDLQSQPLPVEELTGF